MALHTTRSRSSRTTRQSITLNQAQNLRKPFKVRPSVQRAIRQKRPIFKVTSTTRRQDRSTFTKTDFFLSRREAQKGQREIRSFTGRSLVRIRTERLN